MSVRSNITIKSNVYVHKTKFGFDKDFVRQVRGYPALKKLRECMGTFHHCSLTNAQEEELASGSPYCCADKSGDMAWGTVIENNEPVFVCKCEKTDCEGFVRCSSLPKFRPIKRFQVIETVKKDEWIAPDFGLLRYLDPEDKIVYLNRKEEIRKLKYDKSEDASDEIISKEKHISRDVTEDSDQSPGSIQKPNLKLVQTKATSKETKESVRAVRYEKIDDPNPIIEGGIREKVIVNAGPGTGKTYSVIKRLGFIINNELANPDNILVLCYSRSAVSEIRKRINREIDEGNMPVEARQLFDGIRTFDSFVTYMMADELEETINSLDYDARIESFIIQLKKETDAFDWLEYLIVDEMQDLVGVRARMVRAILEQIDCGFLLLGDMCQSIYDYLIDDESELDSVRYYQWLNAYFETKVKRYELTKNLRQKEEIAMFTDYMRDAILSEDVNEQVEALSLCIETLRDDNNMGHISSLEKPSSGNSLAILCRNNAEVSIISNELFSRGIKHHVLKKAQHVDLPSWIAEVLSTYTEQRIGLSAFEDRLLERGYRDISEKWSALKSLEQSENDNVLDLRLLVKALVNGKDVPSELDLTREYSLIISTVHRAKGREYDEVVLISDDFDWEEKTLDENIVNEIKVGYVALTRAKNQISFCHIPKYNTCQLKSKRWIARRMNWKTKKWFCTNFQLGIDGYINPFSFVNKNRENVQERQAYIASLKPGYSLSIKCMDGEYKIFHENFYLGSFYDSIKLELRDAMNKTNHSKRLPDILSDVYVNNVVTIANTKYNEVIAQPYNKSGLWVGIEISGFAKTEWSREEGS